MSSCASSGLSRGLYGLVLVLGLLEAGKAVTVNLDCCSFGDLSILSEGDRYRFQTKRYGSRNYPNNYDCSWTFELGDTCTQMRITCDDGFSIDGDPATNCDGDYLEVVEDLSITRYCGSATPDFTSFSSYASFRFHSNGDGRDAGLRCFAECAGDSAPPATTAAPPATTAAPPATTAAPPATTQSPPASGADCVCGKVNRGARVVGGQVTEVNEYPWQAALVGRGSRNPFCGGTLLNEKWVLTAAHCTEGTNPSSIQVILGEHNYASTTETTAFRFNVVNIINHPDYNSNTLDSDFSLLELSQAVDYSDSDYDHVRPACWPTQDIPDDATATATGWGTTTEGGSQPNVLMEVQVPVISEEQCRELYRPNPITANMVCAGDVDEGGIDTCQGDSGGPFVWQNSNSYEIHGVVSWGIGCARPGRPGVYARVYAVLPWITSNTGGDATCPRNDALPVVVQ